MELTTQKEQTSVIHVELFLSCFSIDELYKLHASPTQETLQIFEVVSSKWKSSLSEKEFLLDECFRMESEEEKTAQKTYFLEKEVK